MMTTELISYDFPTNCISKCNVRYNGVPRRYEETRPVKIQNFTHQRILGIGNQIHLQSLHKLEEERQEQIEKAESHVWNSAQRLQAEKIQEVREEAKKELERVVLQLQKENEQKIKEEALKVEIAMQKLQIEQIKEERKKGDKRLRIAVKECEEKCKQQEKIAVEKAREEEKKIAKMNINKLERKHAAEVESIFVKCEEKEERALEELKKQKDKEREEAIKAAVNAEIIKATKQINALKEEHESNIVKIQDIITSKIQIIDDLKMEYLKVAKSKAKLKQCLAETRQEFQNFINKMKYFDEGQSDYLLPTLDFQQFEEIERIE